MKFKSKIEAYTYAIVLLTKIREKVASTESTYRISNQATLEQGINKIKCAIENHEQNHEVITGYLQEIFNDSILATTDQELINSLIKDIETSDYQQTVKDKYRNPLARRSESEIAISLLQKPTKAMMESVKRVSNELLQLIDDLEDDFNPCLKIFNESIHVIALGAFKKTPTKDEIKQILKENDPTKLPEIMHIHFKFAQSITREVPIKHAPVRQPVGRLAEIIKNIWSGTPNEFFSIAIAKEWGGRQYRSYISDELMYKSPLYTNIRGRGRCGEFDTDRTQQMGLMLKDQEEYEVGLPKHSSSWAADAKSQPADLTSPYVLDLVENDTVYVAGPSGMCSMLLGQMEILANFENEDLKKNYLTVVMSYIVGGGFHSIHEVIGPAQNALGLVPGYNVVVPQYNKLAPPPNYNQFYLQQEMLDPEFALRREQAWQNYLNYFNEYYAPKYIDGFVYEKMTYPSLEEKIKKEKTSVIQQQKIPKELKQAILKEINNYITYNSLESGCSDEDNNQLSFISRVLFKPELTKEQLVIAINFRSQLMSCDCLEQLKTLVNDGLDKNRKAEQNAENTYFMFTKSGLTHSMDRIEKIIDSFENVNALSL